jgi:shikimate kinase
MQRAIFIGAPGSGKSSVGKALSRELSTSFADTDALIVERTGQTIPEIFAELGEPRFRAIEREVVLQTLDSNIGVISLGGGAVLDEGVQAAISQSSAEVIFLRVGINNVLARIGGKGDRPLISSDPEEQWREIIALREPIYSRLATIEISSDDKKPYEVAHELMERMGLSHG